MSSNINALERKILILAAEEVLTQGFVWKALYRSTLILCHERGPKFVSGKAGELRECFRECFASEVPWPDGDVETRSLALLLLIEFLSADPYGELARILSTQPMGAQPREVGISAAFGAPYGKESE
jgi:hypothetical protein